MNELQAKTLVISHSTFSNKTDTQNWIVSLPHLLLKFVHSMCDTLLPRLVVFLLHGLLQVLSELLIQLWDRRSTSEIPQAKGQSFVLAANELNLLPLIEIAH